LGLFGARSAIRRPRSNLATGEMCPSRYAPATAA